MRLLRIEIEGITSLKEKLVIDFEKDLEGEDLFAITGPTGSGKSTILNCISIALYYKSHKDLNPEDFVSLGAKRGRIVLDFELNGDKYTSLWECSLYGVRGTRLKDPKPVKEFYKNGEPVDTKIITPEQVIGLDEDQFQKTVIINQGRFSDFITSPFKDRKLLLEKIYTTENITSFPSFLNKEINKLNDEKALLESTLKGGLPLSEEQYNENKKREAKINEDSIKLESEKKYIELIYNNIKDVVENATKINESKIDILKVRTSLDEVTKELIECEGQFKKSEIDLENFEKHYKKTLPEIESGLHHFNKKSELSKRITDLTLQKDENVLTLEKEIQRLNQLKDELRKKQSDLEGLETQLGKSYTKEQIYNLERIINALLLENTELKNTDSVSAEIMKKLKQSEEKGLSLKEKIKVFKQDNDLVDSSIEIKEQKCNKKLKELEDTLQETQLSCHKIDGWLKEIDELNLQLVELVNQKIELEKEIKEITKKNEETTTNLTLADKEIMLNEGLLAINKCLEMAHKNGQCPVCKSKDLKNLDALVNSIGDTTLLQENKQNYEQELKRINLELTEKNLFFKNIETKKQEIETKKVEISNYIKNIATQLNLGEIETDQALINANLKQKQVEAELVKAKDEIKKYNSIKTEIQLQEQALQTERQKYTDLKVEHEKIESLLKEQLSKKSSLLSELAILTSIKIDFNSSESSDFLKKVRLSRELNDEINSISKLILNLEEGIKRLQEYAKKIESNIKEYTTAILESENKLTEIYKHLDTEKLSELKLQLETDLKLYQDKKILLQKELHSIQLKKGQLVTQIQYKEENIESLENLVLKYMKNIEARELPEHPSEQIKEIEGKTEKIASHESAHFEDWELENISGFHDDVLSYHFHSIKEQLQSLKEESVEIRTLNNSYLSKVAEFQKISKDINSIEDKLISKQRVKDVIGRDEFTRYAISMIEEQLIMMTNKELEKLCDGRYVLFQQEKNKTKGPEFFIKDLWRSSSERPLQSLSGGETFMVSLAMALGLAEMTRGQTEIDTFFIDEGFGTLDQDSLEEVLNILMSIRSRGKQIGIISHIKELTDRLPIRIQLQKNQLGESHLEISTF